MIELYDTPFYHSLSEAEKYYVNGMRDLLRRLERPEDISRFAILEEGVVVRADQPLAMLWECKNPDVCRIGKDDVCGYEVSTVFLSIACGYTGKEKTPLHFETMVFGPKGETTAQKYETLDQAIKGHASMVGCLRKRSEQLLEPRIEED